MKDLGLRDWIYIAAIVGAAAVANYRLGALEARFSTFEANYVRADVFKLTMENLQQKIDEINNDNSPPPQTRIIYRDRPTAEPAPTQKYPSIIPQYDIHKKETP